MLQTNEQVEKSNLKYSLSLEGKPQIHPEQLAEEIFMQVDPIKRQEIAEARVAQQIR